MKWRKLTKGRYRSECGWFVAFLGLHDGRWYWWLDDGDEFAGTHNTLREAKEWPEEPASRGVKSNSGVPAG
jgi:hypothetical protein